MGAATGSSRGSHDAALFTRVSWEHGKIEVLMSV